LPKPLTLSDLPKTWLIDVDGVIFPHNGYLHSADEVPLAGVLEFFRDLSPTDEVVLLSARAERYREQTEGQLHRWGIRFTALLLGLPVGERILINDEKPQGLRTAWALNVPRDAGIPPLLGECQESGPSLEV